ncbi:hypothetical protein FHW12_001087 [Dokdonella fugitiva]|uniref:Dolichyl-phosphate-mannose-protein mannosyltransferase n=1 Tax=Dokdonella fugitiva TaxID=328517 RepID=A0A839EWY7_9GAMM|nr:hypothetical protein [Dokdonella fugitiva]MBA8886896.1 hypothetical protein [Dokdonella fugitiva]
MAARRPVTVLLAMHVAQLAFLLWLVHSMGFCCDASYYDDVASRLFTQGLMYTDIYSGYRSYFVPFVLGALRWPAQWFPSVDATTWMRVSLCCAYSLCSFATTLRVVRRAGWRDAVTIALPVFFNPLVLHQVPLPMQEAVIALLVLPMLVLLLATRTTLARRCALAIVCGGVAFLIRLPMAWLIIACAAYLLACLRWEGLRWRTPGAPSGSLSIAAAVLALAALLGPQLVISHARFHSWAPYPNDASYARQWIFGVDDYRRDTVIEDDHSAVDYATPYRALSNDRKTLAFYVETIPDGPVLALTHAWITLHPWGWRTYPRRAEAEPSLAVLAFSATLVFLALSYFGGVRSRPEERPTMVMLFALVSLSTASVAFAAAETRFGLIGYTAAGVAAARLLADSGGRERALHALPGLAAYVGACLVIAMLLAHTR